MPVSAVVEMTVDGMSYEEILDECSFLEAEDIDQGLNPGHLSLSRASFLARCDSAMKRTVLCCNGTAEPAPSKEVELDEMYA